MEFQLEEMQCDWNTYPIETYEREEITPELIAKNKEIIDIFLDAIEFGG